MVSYGATLLLISTCVIVSSADNNTRLSMCGSPSNPKITSGYECTGALFTAVDINKLNTLKSEEGCVAAMMGLSTQLKGYHCLAFKNCPGSGCTCEVRQGCSSSKAAPHEALQTPAPGINGSLCDKCATSCKANGQECPTPMAPEAPEDVPGDKWEAEWIPLVGMGGGCAAIPTLKGMGMTCSTDLSTSAMFASIAPGIKGSYCDKCATSCKADGQECPTTTAPEVLEDVPEDKWEAEWGSTKMMGGCGAIEQFKGIGLTCAADLSTKDPNFSPGSKARLCDKCAASCKANGQECPPKVQEDVPQDKWGEEWTFIKDLGGCGAIDAAKGMGLTCTTDLAAHAALQASALATTKACLYGVSDATGCPAESDVATSSAASQSSTVLIAIGTAMLAIVMVILQ